MLIPQELQLSHVPSFREDNRADCFKEV